MVLVIVAMVSALAAMRLAIHGQEVAVPALVGMAPGDAERTVSGLGLQMTIERHYYSPQIAEGRIMSQLPLPGTKVRHGWQVRVAQSLGPNARGDSGRDRTERACGGVEHPSAGAGGGFDGGSGNFGDPGGPGAGAESGGE